MSDNSSIEWTEATWNPVRGCTKVSPGCKNCYAETFAERWRGIKGHPFEQGFDLRLVPEALGKPLRWKKPRKIFVNSMSDLFHEGISNEYIAAVFGVMAACPQHTFQVLTKRAERLPKWFEWIGRQDPEPWTHCHAEALAAEARLTGDLAGPIHSGSGGLPGRPWPLPNVQLGVSCEDQKRARERLPYLFRAPAAVYWASLEPLLGDIDLFSVDPEDGEYGPGWKLRSVQNRTDYGTGVEYDVDAQIGLDWVVVGGESGPGARLMQLEWARDIVKQCQQWEVPVFYKQGGASNACVHSRKGGCFDCFPSDLQVREFPR